MYFPFFGMPVDILFIIGKTPDIVRWVVLNWRVLKNLELEPLHIAHQDYRSQKWILCSCFINSGIPNLENLTPCGLNVVERGIVSIGISHIVSSRN